MPRPAHVTGAEGAEPVSMPPVCTSPVCSLPGVHVFCMLFTSISQAVACCVVAGSASMST